MDNHIHGLKGKGEKGEKKYLATPVSLQNKLRLGAEGANYDAELKEILRAGDVLRFRSFLQSSQRALPDEMLEDNTKMQTMMHMLTLSMADLNDLHAASREWLDGNTVLRSVRSLLEASQVTPEEKWQEFEAQQADDEKPKRRTIFLQVPGRSTEDN